MTNRQGQQIISIIRFVLVNKASYHLINHLFLQPVPLKLIAAIL